MQKAENVEDIKPSENTSLALPRTVQELIEQRKSKQKRTLNDMIETLHISLYENTEYQRYLDAVHSEQAVEGDLFCDDIEASRMIRAKAREDGNKYVASQKLATIRKALMVVMRRYGMSRKERREI
jgi:hypothetical protein